MSNNKIFKYSLFLIMTFLSLHLFGKTSGNHKKQFKDYYNLTNVYKAEVSVFKKENYHVVKDYKKLIELIQDSKVVVAKFIPMTEVVFYNSPNDTTYKIYFSKTCDCFSIDGKTFLVGKKESKEIEELLNSVIF